jgi:cysteine synthase A
VAVTDGVCDSVLETIGATPLVALDRLGAGLPGLVLAKLEFLNPGGSVKDRIALRMIEAAEREGRLRPGGVVVELTSGNTGTGLAIVCGVKGYRFIAVMSEGNSVERRRMLRALGAEVVLVAQSGGPRPGQVSREDLALVEERTQQLTHELAAFRPDQFGNPANVAAHDEGTGAEIWAQTRGRVDVWVAAVGTGGTFVGVARSLKRQNPAVRAIAVEPASARVLREECVSSTCHRLEGTGYAEVPPQWDPAVCDGSVGVTDGEARETARLLAAREGIFAGYSSGANVAAALRLAREAPAGQVIVTTCSDTGLKYLSTDLFAPEPGRGRAAEC